MEHFIKNIEITNFKSIRHAEVKDCRRVNVFVGYPNVGKSNILEALSAISYLQDYKENLSNLIRVKGYSEIFFNGNIQEDSTVSVNGADTKANLTYTNESNLKFRIVKNVFNKNVDLVQERDKKIEFSINQVISVTDFKFYIDKKERVKKYSFQNTFNTIRTDGKSLNSPDGSNLFEVIELNLETKNQVKDLFNGYNLKLTFDKNDNQIKLLKALEDDTFYLIPFYQIADTLQRLIFYKTAILTNSKTSLLFEEPEAHMFPPYISQLTSDIIQDKNQNQFFIATHSPFVLNDFMEDLKDDELSIYAVGLENGETTIRRLTDEDVIEIYQYGIDLFFNLENYLTHGKVTSDA